MIRRYLPAVTLVAATLVAWELIVRLLDVPMRILPAPTRIIRAGLADLGSLQSAARVTALETIAGLGLAILVAIAVAFVMQLIPWFRRAASPVLIISQTIPMIALAPLMVIWFGFDPTSKILLVALFAFFPIAVSLQQGLRSITQEQLDVAISLGATASWVLLHIRSKAALQSLLTGLRIAVTYAPATAATAEYVGARQGLGVYLLSASASYRTDLVFAGAAVLTLMTLVLWLAVELAERLTIGRWGAQL